MIELLGAALQNTFEPYSLLLMFLGVTSGIIVGCLPGLTATMALAVLVPFTFTMQAVHGLIAVGAIYVGAIYGGCIAAILVNTPGTPAGIATTFDGFPLTKKGMAEHALATAAFASSFGGLFGTACLLFLSPILAAVALKFGPPEYFWLAVFGLTIISTLASKSILKGIIGGAFGILLGTVGMAPLGGDVRYTFGFPQLQAGIELIVALIGFFCIPEALMMVENRLERYKIAEYKSQKGVAWQVIKELLRKPGLLIRSSIIGTIVGIVPGAGGSIAGMIAYNEAVRFSKYPEKFGTGIIDGVAASESSNNAEVPGSLIPLLTLGIPGAPPAAVLLGALLLHGMRPGPELYTVFGEITYTFILSLFVANILLFLLGLYGARFFARLINLSVNYLIPFIVFLSVIGSYAIRNNMLDVAIMIFFGFVGYATRKLGFHPGPIVLGMILGPFAEKGYVQSVLLAEAAGSYLTVFFLRPLSLFFIFLSVFSAVWPLWRERRQRRSGKEAERA